ncbi:MAG: hypothetical protein WCF85_02755 [Rhodospirillaceae bacterium]
MEYALARAAESSSLLSRLPGLERRYDGAIPAELLGERTEDRNSNPTIGLQTRLAANARSAAARRRQHLAAGVAIADAWLNRLVAGLAFHRAAALGE